MSGPDWILLVDFVDPDDLDDDDLAGPALPAPPVAPADPWRDLTPPPADENAA